jgi:hypothetical protein
MQAQKYKEPTFENVEVGETFGPVTLKTDDFFLKSYAYATDDYSAVEIVDGQVRATGFVPGAAIVSELMLVFLTVYDPDGVVGLHQKEEAEYFAPVPVGTTLTLTGRYIDKYERRGKGYCVLEAEARDESGRLVVRQRSTEIMRIPKASVLVPAAASPIVVSPRFRSMVPVRAGSRPKLRSARRWYRWSSTCVRPRCRFSRVRKSTSRVSTPSAALPRRPV